MKTLTIKTVVAFLLSFSTVACTQIDDANIERRDGTVSPLMDGKTACTLEFLNDPTTTLSILDEDAELDARAAKNLIAHRNGPDGVFGTPDDNIFDSRGEAGAVYWVGESTLEKVQNYAVNWCQSQPNHVIAGTFHGVSFTHLEARLVLRLVNNTAEGTVSHLLDFNPDAQNQVLTMRPFNFIHDLANLDSVEATELEMLKSVATLDD